jgi:multidrug efflux pump subunit AcrA (membrane-fusion protein)
MKKKILFLIVILLFLIFCGKKDQVDHGHEHEAASETTSGHDHEVESKGKVELDNEHEEANETAQNHEAESEDNAEHDHLHVATEMMREWGIGFGSPERRDYIEKVMLTGIAKVNINRTFLINSLVPGVVIAIKKDIGNRVTPGSVLCVLNSPELLQLKTNYVKAHQEFLYDMQNYGRAKNLFRDKALERKELIGRETKYRTSLAEYLSLEAGLHSLGFSRKLLKGLTDSLISGETGKLKEFLSPFYSIPAPGYGKVISRDLTPGELIEKNKTIFEISDTRKLWAILDVRENDLQHISKGKHVEIFSDVYPEKIFKGIVSAISEKVDTELRTVKVRVEVDNEKYLLKPEMYVKGNLQKNIKKDYICVPGSAVVKMSGSDGVFLKDTDGFRFKPVQIIDRDSAGFVFVSGLKKNEIIVTKGAFYLKAEYEIKRGAIDAHAGHQH